MVYTLYQKEWYQQNKERLIRRQQERRETDPKVRLAINANARKRRAADPEKRRAYLRDWWARNPILRRNYWYKKKYGILCADYERMFAFQKGLCATCNKPELKFKTLCIDHNHITGRVRKLLCHKCNSALGMVDENIETLLNLVKYLEAHI